MFFFVPQLMITWLGIPKIGTHDAFIDSHVESKFQLSTFYRLLIMSKLIFICQNLQTKTKVLRAHAKSQQDRGCCYIRIRKLLSYSLPQLETLLQAQNLTQIFTII